MEQPATVPGLIAAASISTLPGSVVTEIAATSKVALAANPARKKCRIYNNGAGIVYLLLASGSASASNHSGYVLNPTDAFETELFEYTGVISAFSAAALSLIVAEGV